MAGFRLTHPIIRPLLKIREYSKFRLTLASRAAAETVRDNSNYIEGYSRFAGALCAIVCVLVVVSNQAGGI
jgi:hypothetical protein